MYELFAVANGIDMLCFDAVENEDKKIFAVRPTCRFSMFVSK